MSRNPVRGLPREVLVLSAVAFAIAIGFGILAPAIPVFAREFGVTRTAAAAVISAFAFMRFVSALGSGQLVDRFGERRVLATGIWIVAGSSGLAGLAQSYPQLLLLRGIGGVGSAMFTVAAMSLLLRVVDSDRRGQATATWQAGFLLGGILGPGVGGALAANSVRAPFFVYAGTLAVAGAIGMLYLRRPSASERAVTASPDGPAESAPPPGIGLRVALSQRAYLAALTASLATGWSLFGVRTSLMPPFVTELLGLTTVWTGLGFLTSAAVQVVALIPAARITDRVGRRPSLIVGTALASVSYLLVAVNETLASFLGSMVIFGVAAAFLGVAPASIVGDVVTRSAADSGAASGTEPRRIRGSRGGLGSGRAGRSGRGDRAGRGGGKAVAIYQMASDFGVIVGPLVAGWLADRYSFSAAFAATAVLIGTACAMAIWMPETRTVRQPEPAETATRE